VSNIDDLVKSIKTVMPGLIRHSEAIGITGFRLAPEWRFKGFPGFLRIH